MDPTKPASKPKAAQSSLPSAMERAKPKKTFQATLAERQKADEQAADPDEDIQVGLRIVEEQVAIHMSRSLLSQPKGKRLNVEREKSESEEDV